MKSVNASMKICAEETVKLCAALDTMAAEMSSMAETKKRNMKWRWKCTP